MSEETHKNPSPRLGRAPAALIGLVVVLLIIFLVNYVVGLFNIRADLTEYKVFTLSKGTKNILAELETPVTVRYYVTDDARIMSPAERSQARRVEDLLDEYVENAPVREIELVNDKGEFEKRRVRMLTVKKLNPEPNTDAEDAAIIDGLQAGISGETNNEIFFGIAVECLDQRETIPFVPARPETVLEYDLSRAISNVHGGKDKAIRVMTGMQVGGGMGMNFQAPPTQPWMFYEQLSRDYEVEVIPSTSAEVPADTAALIVLHPFDITDEGQYAIDQYLLGGGNVIVFLDPNFFYARALGQSNPQMPGMPPQGGPAPTSNLDKLLGKWGVKYDANRVLADLDYGSEIIRRGNFSPTFLTLGREAVDPADGSGTIDDRIVSMLQQLNMLTPGGFELEPPAGVEAVALVQSSPTNQLVSSFDADPTQEGGADRIREDFESFGKRRALVARLTGTFKTAFPEGNPAASDEEDEETSPDEEGEGAGEEGADADSGEKEESLAESVEPGRVLLVADVDFIYDANVVRRQEIPGLGIQIPQFLNENLTLVQNAVEQFSGDPDLINVRSRSNVRRPFTRQSEWYREAQQKYQAQLAEFEEKAEEATDRINQILTQTPQDIDEALLSPEVQSELQSLQEQQVEFRRNARELEKEVTREFRRKLATFKFGNSFAMPALVIVFGIGLAVFRKAQTQAR